jgi:hypothetical protein
MTPIVQPSHAGQVFHDLSLPTDRRYMSDACRDKMVVEYPRPLLLLMHNSGFQTRALPHGSGGEMILHHTTHLLILTMICRRNQSVRSS